MKKKPTEKIYDFIKDKETRKVAKQFGLATWSWNTDSTLEKALLMEGAAVALISLFKHGLFDGMSIRVDVSPKGMHGTVNLGFDSGIAFDIKYKEHQIPDNEVAGNDEPGYHTYDSDKVKLV